MSESPPNSVIRPDREDQIVAVMGPDIFRWAVGLLPEGVMIDDVRYRDLIDVSEDEVLAYVQEHGFDRRVVWQDGDHGVRDDVTCLVRDQDIWRVFYTERGETSREASFAGREDAVREIIRRQMRLARVVLNSRYWHAHDLPYPITSHDE